MFKRICQALFCKLGLHRPRLGTMENGTATAFFRWRHSSQTWPFKDWCNEYFMEHGEEECAWCGARRRMIALSWGIGVTWRYRRVVAGPWERETAKAVDLVQQEP